MFHTVDTIDAIYNVHAHTQQTIIDYFSLTVHADTWSYSHSSERSLGTMYQILGHIQVENNALYNYAT